MYKHTKNGFTLIELLVVIAIIAILSVVAVSIFRGVNARAQDARRRADVNSIAKALEAHYDASSGTYPIPLQGNWFSSGSIPTDPSSTAPIDPTTGTNYPLTFSGVVGATATGYQITATLSDSTTVSTTSSQGLFVASAVPTPTPVPTPPPTPPPTPTPTPVPGPPICAGGTLTSGLVGYWKFDDAPGTVVADAASVPHNGSAVGTTITTGKINSARNFNSAAADYVFLPAFSIGGVSPNAVAISAWIKNVDFASAIRHTIFATSSSGQPQAWSLETGATPGEVSVIIPGSFMLKTVGGAIADANFHHIVYIRRDATTHEIWVDGVPKTFQATPLTTSYIDYNESKLIGVRTVNSQHWNGVLDEIGLWNRALTTAEVGNLNNTGSGCMIL